MAAVYEYNGVILQLAQTLQFSWEMERDPTGTDAMYTKYTIRVKGFVSTSTIDIPKDTGATVFAIKAALETPRRAMLYTLGSTTMLASTGMDAKIGPAPTEAIVREVSTGTFYVECGCILYQVDCNPDCSPADPVVSLRWTQSESFDQNWNSKLVTDGLLIVRSDLLQSADNFRVRCTPPLLPDYIRTAASYTLSPDGLQLQFHFEDLEADRLPTFPATQAKGTYIVVTPQTSFGFTRIGTVDIELIGPKGTNRRDLMNRAVAMAYSKLERDLLRKGPPVYWGEFHEDLYEPRVHVKISSFMSNLGRPAGTSGNLAGAIESIASPGPKFMPSVGLSTLGLASNRPGIKPPDRKRIAGLLTAMFSDPCACVLSDGDVTLVSTRSASSFVTNPDMLPPASGTPPADISIGDAAGGFLNAISSLLIDTAPYTNWSMEITTVYDTGLVQMPGTGVGVNGQRCAVVQSSGGMMTVLTSWVASRTGAAPQLPTFISTNPNLVGLGGAFVAQDVKPAPDGQNLVYLFGGYYRHAVLDPALYEIAPDVAPFFNSDVQQAALLGATGWSNLEWDILNSARAGSNPFLGQVSNGPPAAPPGFGNSGGVGTIGDALNGQQPSLGADVGIFTYIPTSNP